MSATPIRKARRESQRKISKLARSLGITLDQALEQLDPASDAEKAQLLSAARKPSSRHFRKPHVFYCKEVHRKEEE